MNPELDAFMRIGERVNLGSHRFTEEEIITFAQEFDPQYFHVDPKRAADSIFGGLCASGWHTCAMWMRYNCAERKRSSAKPWTGPGPRPEMGPSPGFRNLRWIRPIFAGDTVTFYRTALAHRDLATRPGWLVLQIKAEAVKADGQPAMEMENAVLFKYSTDGDGSGS